MPGRARVRVAGLRNRPAFAAALEARLSALPGVRSVRASAITGSVLVLHAPPHRHTRRLIEDIGEAWRVVHADGATSRSSAVTGNGTAPATAIVQRETARVAWHALPPDVAIEHMDADVVKGLTRADVAERAARFGANDLPLPRPKTPLEILRGHLVSTPVLLLGGAALLSVVTGAVVDAAVILAVVGLNAAIGFVTERRVERILTSLQRVGAPQALARRDGQEMLVAGCDLVPGDTVVLKAGHEVLADLRVVVADGLAVDESSLTGESVPTLKSSDARCGLTVPLGDRRTMAYAGTTVVEGTGVGIVVETGARTELGAIRTLVAESVMPPTPLERQLDGAGRRLVGVALGLCGGAFALGILRGAPVFEMLRVAISLAVAAVPEGLPTVATTTLALGTHRMLKRRTLVRRLAAVESLGATTVICADKTGTITENRMTLAGWHLAGRDYPPPVRGAAVDALLARALTVGVLCSDAELDPRSGAVLGSSTEGALVLAARDAGIDYRALRARYRVVDVRPRLDGDHWMGTTHADGDRRLVFVKGAPERVLAQSSRWLDGAAEQRLDDEVTRRMTAEAARIAARGLRVLGLAYRESKATDPITYDDLVWLGLVAFTDPVRPGVREALAACRAAGIRTIILTGDHAETAAAVGRDLGLGRDGAVHVVEASALVGVDGEALRQLVLDVDVFARVSPADKYQIVRALQAGGAVVAMTGDGMNDAAALRAADIGVAMGARGTDVARDVADVVLLDDDFAGLVHAVAQGRTIHANIDKSLRFLLATNASEILVTLTSLGIGAASPLSPVHLLWINLLSDVLPALALAVEPSEPDVMTHPPRDPAQPLLRPRVLATIAADATVLSAATLGVHALGVGRYGTGARASTMAFSALTAGQLVHALTLRSAAHTPRLLAGVVGGSIALHALAMTVPALRALLGTAPLSLGDWSLVAAGAAVPLALKTIRRPSIH